MLKRKQSSNADLREAQASEAGVISDDQRQDGQGSIDHFSDTDVHRLDLFAIDERPTIDLIRSIPNMKTVKYGAKPLTAAPPTKTAAIRCAKVGTAFE